MCGNALFLARNVSFVYHFSCISYIFCQIVWKLHEASRKTLMLSQSRSPSSDSLSIAQKLQSLLHFSFVIIVKKTSRPLKYPVWLNDLTKSVEWQRRPLSIFGNLILSLLRKGRNSVLPTDIKSSCRHKRGAHCTICTYEYGQVEQNTECTQILLCFHISRAVNSLMAELPPVTLTSHVWPLLPARGQGLDGITLICLGGIAKVSLGGSEND